MKPKALFVVGAPGVGKTSLIRTLLNPMNTSLVPKPKWTVSGKVCAAGHYTGQTFDGADMVPYNGARDALVYFDEHLAEGCDLVVFDGDRFSNKNCVQFLKDKGYEIHCLHLYVGNPEILKERREKRGSKQNETWLKGRVTKAKNFAASLDAEHLSCDQPVRVLAGYLKEMGHVGWA